MLNRGGSTITYCDQENTENKDLKEIDELGAPSCNIDALAGMLEEAKGKCGAWAEAFAFVLANEGVKSKVLEIAPEFIVGAEDKCETFKTCNMLIKGWKFNGAGTSGNASFPYKATEVEDERGVKAQGVENPPAIFSNHYIVETPKGSGKLYDPSYGTGPYEGANPLKELQENGIAAFGAATSL